MRGGRDLRAVLFDLDGTLLDTAPDMADALNTLRVAEGLDRIPFERIRPLVSHGAPRLIRFAFDEPEGARYEALRMRFLEIYSGALAVRTRLFDGFDHVLGAVEQAGLQWGIVTNKPGWLTAPLLAQTGLLAGRRATTTWWLATAFRRQFPDIELDASEMLVQDGDFYTTGAATAIFSLISHMVAQAGGNDLAQQVSRLMVMDADRQSQAPYISQALLDKPRHGLTEKAQKFLEKELHREISVGELAEVCNVSERSLLRHFQAQHGMSPLSYMQHLRVERAKALLEASHFSFEEIVERCGYRDVPSFRKLFKRETSITPADYRDRFRLRAR